MFVNVLTQVVILFILIMLGAALTKSGILTESGVTSITDTVLMLVTPCLIIKSFIRPFDKSLLKELVISFAIAVLAHVGFIILSRLLLHSKEKSVERVLRFGAVFSNCGYMSLPLQQSILGDMGVFYAASFIAIFNLFAWSYGIILISGDKKYFTPKKLLINPGLIGIAVGLVIFLFSIPVPKVLSEPISYIAALNTPLPMIIIGYHLTKSNLFAGLKNAKCMLAILLRLVILPLLVLGVAYLFGIRGDMLVSTAISCSAPIAAITTMFAYKFSADTSLSVNMVSLSTVFSLITMPCIITFAQYIA